MKEQYEINRGTLALISLKDGNTKVLEDYKIYVIPESTYNILNYSCKYFGSSYEGRLEGSKSVIGSNYKLPIVIQDNLELVFFPTTSPRDSECIWLAAHKIKDFIPESYNTTKIIFNNGVEVVIPVSSRVIENQIYRATRLTYVLKEHNSMA